VARHSYSAADAEGNNTASGPGVRNSGDSPTSSLGLHVNGENFRSASPALVVPDTTDDAASGKPPLPRKQQSPSAAAAAASAAGDQLAFLVSPLESPEYEPKPWGGKKDSGADMEAAIPRKQLVAEAAQRKRMWIAFGVLLVLGIVLLALWPKPASTGGLVEITSADTSTPVSPAGKSATHKDEEVQDIADRYAGSAHRPPGMLSPDEMKHEEEEHMDKDTVEGDHTGHNHPVPSNKAAATPATEEEDPEEERKEGQNIADHEEVTRLRHAADAAASAASVSKLRSKRSLVPRLRNRRRASNLETAFADSPGAELLQLASDDVPRESVWGKGIGKRMALGKVSGKMTKESKGLWVVENAES